MSADEQLRLRFVELGAYGRLITSRIAADMGHHDGHVFDREVSSGTSVARGSRRCCRRQPVVDVSPRVATPRRPSRYLLHAKSRRTKRSRWRISHPTIREYPKVIRSFASRGESIKKKASFIKMLSYNLALNLLLKCIFFVFTVKCIFFTELYDLIIKIFVAKLLQSI